MWNVSDVAADQHLAWLARSFGRPDYLPLTPADLEVLAGCATVIDRYRGSHIFRQDEAAKAAFLVRNGQVDIYRRHSGEDHVVARVGPGSVIGDIAMFGEGKYLSSARAVDHVKVFRFARETLLPELAKHPSICLRWLVSGLRQLEQTQRRIIHLMHKTVLAQVADLLVEEAATGGEVRLSQAAIAALLGVSRQSVNEAIGQLKERGLVDTGYGVIAVRDAPGLGAVAADAT